MGSGVVLTSRRFRRRLWAHHLPLLIGSAALSTLLAAVIDAPDPKWRWSMATAYVATGLLAVALLLGPLNVWFGRSNPTSTDVRRDIGIWAGLGALVHTVLGFRVHMDSWLEYFVRATSGPKAWKPHLNLFGLANYVGLVAALLFVLLVAISNDWSLRRFGARRWKWLQRSTYVVLALVALHGAAYQLVEKRTLGFVLVFGAEVVVVTVGQLLGMWSLRRTRGAGRA
jgi:sulfoxide reductase heme-binding subunit YedZ